MDPKANDRRVTNQTDDPNEARIEALLELFPEIVGEVDGATGRRLIDYDRLQEILSGRVDDADERYNFTWAGKASARRSLRLPAVGTLRPAPEESVNWDTTRNIFIEGENFETLKLLLRPYYGQVKMIYIDPPYNTGGDFVYPDNYADPLEHYYRVTGQKDTEGNLLTTNKETNGRFHSNWLNMMYPRLWLARQLLRGEGVIFVSIDDNEVHNLRLLMDEVFGEDNLVCQLVWRSRRSEDTRAISGVSVDHEYVLCYRRSSDATLRGVEKDLDKFSNPDSDARGPWRSADLTGLATRDRRPNLHYDLIDPSTGISYGCPPKGWRFDPNTMRGKIEEGRILFPEDGKGRPRHKLFLEEMNSIYKNMSSIILDTSTGDGTRELNGLLGDGTFSFPKPSTLLRKLIDQATSDDDLVLDFFAGSGTAAQAVVELNRDDAGRRRFVLVQLPEPTQSAPLGTLADIAKERLRRVISQMNEQGEPGDHEDRGFRVYKLGDSTMRSWQAVETEEGSEPTQDDYAKQMELFEDPLKAGWTPEDVIAELALKEAHIGLDYRLEAVDGVDGQTVYRVSEPDTDRRFYVCLDDAVAVEPLRAVDMDQETLFVCRAVALDDETTANLAMQCRLRVI